MITMDIGLPQISCPGLMVAKCKLLYVGFWIEGCQIGGFRLITIHFFRHDASIH